MVRDKKRASSLAQTDKFYLILLLCGVLGTALRE